MIEVSLLWTDHVSLFLLGLLSSVSHCVGMCGGFVYCYTSQLPNESRSITPHVIYNLGRLTTYSLLGAVFGLIGETTQQHVPFVSWQVVILVLAAIVMLVMSLEILGLSRFSFGFARSWEGVFVRFVQKFLRRSGGSLFPLGLVLGAIPCGLVYAAGLKAAASGSGLLGASLMFSFGLGTVPAMVAMGWLGKKVAAPNRRWLYKISGVVIFVISLMTLHQAWQMSTKPNTAGHHHHTQ